MSLRAVRLRRRSSTTVVPRRAAQRGQGLVEYALILVIVSIVAIFLIVSMGGQLTNMLSNVVAALGM